MKTEDDELIQDSEVRVVGRDTEVDQPVEETEEPSPAESDFLDEEPPKPKEKPADKVEQPKETAKERRERATLEAELRAAKEEVEYWRTNRTAPAPAPEPKPSKPESAPKQTLTVDQQLDLLVRDPAAYLAQAGKQAGMVTAEEAERIAEERAIALLEKHRAAQREETQLLGEFGDLSKPDSELFKRTTRILRESGVDEKSVGDTRLLRMAAKMAKSEIDAEAAKSKGKQDRIAAQGPTGRRVSGDAVVLSETARRFAEKMGIKDMSLVEREARRMKGGQ